MENWDSIDGVREQSIQLTPEEARCERIVAFQKVIDDIKILRSETLLELALTLEQRKIEHFVHFTRFENLEGILKFGLIPPKMLESSSLPTPCIRTDKSRSDGIPEANCLSVTHPNHFMFKNKRADGKRWVVLGFSAAKVLRLPSIFIGTNAAIGGRKCRRTASLRYMRNQATPQAFEQMFPDEKWCGMLNIAPNETIDAQAEVMVLETIPPEMLTFVAPYRTSLPELELLFSLCPSHVKWLLDQSEQRTRLVSGRVDDSFWQSIKYGRNK